MGKTHVLYCQFDKKSSRIWPTDFGLSQKLYPSEQIPYIGHCEYYYLRVNFTFYHCVESVQIRSFFWSVFSRILTEYGEILRISP